MCLGEINKFWQNRNKFVHLWVKVKNNEKYSIYTLSY